MNYTFTGDLILQDLEKFTKSPFERISELLKNTRLIINLESPFIDDKCNKQIKTKLTLHQTKDNLEYLKQLNPYMITLSNNHINDYGNSSINLTTNLLKSNGFKYIGVGNIDDKSHVQIDKEKKIIFISYTTRETDLTDNILFATRANMGPKDINYNEIQILRKQYNSYKIVVLLHWGVEYIPLPLPSQRERAYKLIEFGVDLIVGHHSHIIQPYEIYNNKYIFYSLGNFLFPDISFKLLNGEQGNIYQKASGKSGLICKFDIKNNNLEKLYIVKRNDKCILYFDEIYNNQLNIKNNNLYILLYKSAVFKYKLREFLERIPRIPSKLKIILKGKSNS